MSHVLGTFIFLLLCTAAVGQPAGLNEDAEQWRREHRLIDMHQHIDSTTEHLTQAVKIIDAAGIGIAVNLGTGTVTRPSDGRL